MATPTIEEYLETIYVIAAENLPVRSARVAEVMGVSAPTVTDTVKRLIQQGYVTLGKAKEILLTDDGRQAAESLVRRHRLSERWLVDVLGMDWSKVHDEACRLEHALSAEVEERLARSLNSPSTCPHGNPIPGYDFQPPTGRPLAQLDAGREATLLRISPEGEKDSRLLDYLKECGIVPGTRIRVLEVAPWKGLVTVEVGERAAPIGIDAASYLWVLPVDQPDPSLQRG